MSPRFCGGGRRPRRPRLTDPVDRHQRVVERAGSVLLPDLVGECESGTYQRFEQRELVHARIISAVALHVRESRYQIGAFPERAAPVRLRRSIPLRTIGWCGTTPDAQGISCLSFKALALAAKHASEVALVLNCQQCEPGAGVSYNSLSLSPYLASPQTVAQAFGEGRSAFESGATSPCPYINGTDERDAWHRGHRYEQRTRDEQERRVPPTIVAVDILEPEEAA